MRKIGLSLLFILGLGALVAVARSDSGLPWQQVVIADDEYVRIPGHGEVCRTIGAKSGCFPVVLRGTSLAKKML